MQRKFFIVPGPLFFYIRVSSMPRRNISKIVPPVLALIILLSGLALVFDNLGGAKVVRASTQPALYQGGITNITATPDYCFKGVYCIGDLLAERSGYASNVTGGLNGYIYFVNTTEDDPENPKPGSLRYALEHETPLWIFFQVNGTIYLKSRVEMKSHKTIDGRGAQIVISGNTLSIKNVENVIIVNIRFDSTDLIKVDGIEIRKSTNIWIHHCDFTNWSDGAIDLAEADPTRLSNITISWSRFWNHNKNILIGNSNTRTTDSNFRVTLHHNFFFMTKTRHPRLRFGVVDAYNNYLYWTDEGFGPITQGQALLHAEANIIEPPPGTEFELADCEESGQTPGYFLNVNNVYPENAKISGCLTNITYTRPYPAQVDPPNEELKLKIMRYAGTDFPAYPRLMVVHPQTDWDDYIWDVPLPTAISSQEAYLTIDIPPYRSPEEEVVELTVYMGDGTEYSGTPLEFLNHEVSSLFKDHKYASPGTYTVSVVLRTRGGNAVILYGTLFVNVPEEDGSAGSVTVPLPTLTVTETQTVTETEYSTVYSTVTETTTVSTRITETTTKYSTVTETTTETRTVTSTVRETVTIPSPTTVRETVTDWTVTAAVGIVLLVVGIAIGYIIKRR